MVKVLYFARLREALGTASEDLVLPPSVSTLEGLRAVLVSRGGTWSEELAASRRVRVAINQAMADEDSSISDGDEVAFFPPVTGG
ncbi:MAG TPA: molybdopterin converting factor subunit 1 [Burkholderiales bacterium]|nr:molybdopterin converting factor subunit 1 [Burkholderiales bacterium]